ncbi:MAG: deoxyribose-phosphate aldolase [Candidatus Shapirobacteria bacterium]|nr:deoxyribose-phosphate aldolase [Candidatus Shapirobacteria bacterium]
MDRKTLVKYLDLANHHPETTSQMIKELCQKVQKFGFHTAFVNPCYVTLAKDFLKPINGLVGTVISFPLGQETQDIKVMTAIKAVKDGADELDVSMNVGLFKDGQEEKVLNEMGNIVTAAKSLKKVTVVKFIIETGLLTDEEIKKASLLVLKSGADFVKTCSGMGPRGASVKDVKLIKSVVGGKIKIKAAGGIDTYQEALALIEAGVDRIGTSKAVEIVEGLK